jgi:type II secretory ATPase GspE/PulE/Tfp pilus assembly ATPase PilB-like protein
MLTMLQDGILKCLEGKTSLAEIYRVSGDMDYIDELYDIVISQTIGRGIKIKKEEEALAEDINKNLSTINDKFEKINTDKILNIILALSLQAEAGDIHIEPTDKNIKIRFRIDGVLHNIIDLPKDHYLPLLSKIKILIGIPTNEKKSTIDGRFTIYLPNKEKSDCRVSIISGGYGETIVIRLLSQQAVNLKIKDLGIIKHSLAPLKKSIEKTKGIILATGPTGSGKTTTLYSILNKLNTPDVKIITMEDPIEYQLPGLIQTQINIEKGYTFATAMRSLLRQNPNILMIGEIRDKETADIAIEAALTGHLVLSTLHANSAAGAISRLSGLGVSKQLLAGSLECSIGQRLVRKVCEHCKEEVKPTAEQKERINQILSTIPNIEKLGLTNNLKFYKGRGCNKCNNLGYKGRIGIYEIIEIGPKIKKLIQSSNVIDYEIEQLAIKNGTVTMLQDGLIKASLGITSLEEIFRVL